MFRIIGRADGAGDTRVSVGFAGKLPLLPDTWPAESITQMLNNHGDGWMLAWFGCLLELMMWYNAAHRLLHQSPPFRTHVFNANRLEGLKFQ